MQPTTTTPQLPVTFWAQLFARLDHHMPAFYSVIQKKAVYLSLASTAFPFITTFLLPMLGVEVPKWLTFSGEQLVAIVAALAGIGAGAAGVAQTTIQTPSTPPLSGDTPKVTVEELAAEVAALKAQLAQPTPISYVVPGSGGTTTIDANTAV